MGIQINGQSDEISAVDGSGIVRLDVDGNIIGDTNVSGALTATTSVTVGDAFLKPNAVGLGTTNTSGRNAGINTAPGTIIYNAETGSVQVYKQNAGWSTIQSTGDQPPGGIEASGGFVSDYTDPGPGNRYRSHTFTSSGTFVVSALATSEPNSLEYLVIAGGGGGGTAGTGGAAGGGGAGGYRSSVNGESSGGGGSAESTITAAVQSYTVTIGAGGAADTWVPGEPNRASDSGNPSSFDSITSIGGGGGAVNQFDGLPGGSGGGTNRRYTNAGGSGTANQGYAGGGGPSLSGDNTGCGGGGAGAVGVTATSPAQDGGAGGAGVESSIDGTATFRAGGGGAGGNNPGPYQGGAVATVVAALAHEPIMVGEVNQELTLLEAVVVETIEVRVNHIQVQRIWVVMVDLVSLLFAIGFMKMIQELQKQLAVI